MELPLALWAPVDIYSYTTGSLGLPTAHRRYCICSLLSLCPVPDLGQSTALHLADYTQDDCSDTQVSQGRCCQKRPRGGLTLPSLHYSVAPQQTDEGHVVTKRSSSKSSIIADARCSVPDM